MIFDLKDIAYETYLQHAQIEVTGLCNMGCKHCRAANEKGTNLSLEQISKILEFIEYNKEEDFRITISGGEPFIHPKLVEIIALIKSKGIEDIIITSNASLITDKKIKQLNNLDIKNLCIQLSLDSIYPNTHDEFRNYKGAYDGVISAINIIKKYDNVKASLRMTVTHETCKEVETMIDKAYELGVERIGIGAVIPVGAGQDGKLTLSSSEKKKFLQTMAKKKVEYAGRLDVTTEDPLKFAITDTPWEFCEENCEIGEDFFGGCTAGITGFNVNAEGLVTPCAVLFEPVLNINDYDNVLDMTHAYESSTVIKRLITRKFYGKCGTCKLNRICGGCRATAKGLTDDYMGSDGTCWI